MYKTPLKFDPIWVAKRIRCASPPDNDPATRSKVKYSSPTLFKKLKRSLISLMMGLAIISLAVSNVNCST